MREDMKYNPRFYQMREEQIKRMLEIINQRKDYVEGNVVFFGDSNMEMMDLNKWFPYLKNCYNCGVGGFTTAELLYFVDEAVLKYKPKVVVLTVGTNDLGETVMRSPREIAMNVYSLVDIISRNIEGVKILLISPLPCSEEKQGFHYINRGLRSNEILKLITKEYKALINLSNVIFIPTYEAFVNEDGKAKEEFYELDGLHLNQQGYKIYSKIIQEYLN